MDIYVIVQHTICMCLIISTQKELLHSDEFYDVCICNFYLFTIELEEMIPVDLSNKKSVV